MSTISQESSFYAKMGNGSVVRLSAHSYEEAVHKAATIANAVLDFNGVCDVFSDDMGEVVELVNLDK